MSWLGGAVSEFLPALIFVAVIAFVGLLAWRLSRNPNNTPDERRLIQENAHLLVRIEQAELQFSRLSAYVDERAPIVPECAVLKDDLDKYSRMRREMKYKEIAR